MKNDGRLTKETFAVAMHLINGVLEGKELPNVLPVTLIPPSVRGSVGLPGAPAAPVQVLSQAQQDLLSLDEDISSPPVKATSPPPIISQISGSAFHSNLQSPGKLHRPIASDGNLMSFSKPLFLHQYQCRHQRQLYLPLVEIY